MGEPAGHSPGETEEEVVVVTGVEFVLATTTPPIAVANIAAAIMAGRQ